MKLLTPKEVSQMFQLSLSTVSRMASAGQIPHIVLKAGRRKKVIRFKSEQVERWLAERTLGSVRETSGEPKGSRKPERVFLKDEAPHR